MNFQYKEKSNKAFALHQAGREDEAEVLYRELLKEQPEDVNVLNLFGLLLISKKEYSEAISLLSKAMLYKKDSYVACNLAKAYYLNEEYEKSVKMFKTAVSYGEDDDIYFSMALSYKKLNKLKESAESYKKAVEINPKNTNAYYNLILLYIDNNQPDKAIDTGLEACKNNENIDEIYTLLTGLYESKGEYKKAAEFLEKAIAVSPKEDIYYFNLGVLYGKMNKYEKAAENYRKSLLLNPKNVDAYLNISDAYKHLKRNDIAVQYLETVYSFDKDNEKTVCLYAQALRKEGRYNECIELLNEYIQKNPNCAEAYSVAGMNAMDMKEYEKALEFSTKASQLNPDNLSYKHGIAIALKYLGKTDGCKKILEELVKSKDADSQTKITLGMLYLQNKEFEKGMKLYTERNNDTGFNSIFKNKAAKQSDDITGKTLILYSNCGLGDTIMYSRFFNSIKEKCKSLILQTDVELCSFMKFNFPDIEVIKKSSAKPDFDTAMPVMDIPYFLGIDFSGLKPQAPYLSADENLVENFREKIFSRSTKPKIGLFYKGNQRIFKNRSVDFSIIKDFVKDERFDFYSFQTEGEPEKCDKIISLKPYIKNFNDTAALMKNLDLFISIDSSPVHAAGALGIKTFLVLPYTAEWRWFNDTESTIWYDSVKIFKQTKINDFNEVFERIKKEI